MNQIELLVFRNPDRYPDESTCAVVKAQVMPNIRDAGDLYNAIRAAVTQWVRHYPDGAKARKETRDFFNLGDLVDALSVSRSPLHNCLSQLGVKKLSIKVLSSTNVLVPSWEYDDQLLDDNVLDAPVRKDQYGEPVPDDLVVIGGDLYQNLTPEDRRIVSEARWYEDANGLLMAPAAEIQNLSEVDPEDCDGITGDVLAVADVLKRCSDEDGFYHA